MARKSRAKQKIQKFADGGWLKPDTWLTTDSKIPGRELPVSGTPSQTSAGSISAPAGVLPSRLALETQGGGRTAYGPESEAWREKQAASEKARREAEMLRTGGVGMQGVQPRAPALDGEYIPASRFQMPQALPSREPAKAPEYVMFAKPGEQGYVPRSLGEALFLMNMNREEYRAKMRGFEAERQANQPVEMEAIRQRGEEARLASQSESQKALERMRQSGQMALEERKAKLESEDPYKRAAAELYGAQARRQVSAADLEDLRMKLVGSMGSDDPKIREQATSRYNQLFGSKEKTSVERAEIMKQVELGMISPEEGNRLLGLSGTPGYADGGVISTKSPMQRVNPLLSQYGQYLNAASQAGVPPVPFNDFMGLLETTRGAMQKSPATFADGGDVESEDEAIPVAGRMVRGPGTETSDSIPAVINGEQPAALSDGEYVIPARVVRAKGTEFFDKLIAQYEDKGSENG